MYINVAVKAQNLFNNYHQSNDEATKSAALANPLFSWHVTYFTTNHKKNLVFLNDATTLAVILYNVNAKNKQDIKERFETQLKTVWLSLGLSAKSYAEYLATSKEWQINKTINRSSMGSLTLLCREVAEPLANTRTEGDLSKRLTNYLKRQGKNYINASDTVAIIKASQPFNIKQGAKKASHDNKGALKEIFNKLQQMSQLSFDTLSLEQTDQAIQKIQDQNNQLLDLFISDIQQDYSDKTIRRYKNNLQFYLNEWAAYRLSTIANLENASINELLYHGSSETEVRNIKAALKQLLRYLKRNGIINNDQYEDYLVFMEEDSALMDEFGSDDDLYNEDNGDFFTSFDSLINDTNKDLPTIFDTKTDQLFDDYLASFASLYGLIPVHHALQIIQAQNPQLTIVEEKFQQYIEDRVGEYELRYVVLDLNKMADEINLDAVFEDDLFIVYPTLLSDSIRLVQLYNHQLGLQYYVPDKAELLRYKYDDYFDIYNLREQLDELFITHYELSGSSMVGAAFICIFCMKLGMYDAQNLSSMNDAIDRAIQMLNNTVNLNITRNNDNEALIKLLLLIGTDIRRPWNRGWSSREILDVPGIAGLFNHDYPVLSSDAISAIQQGKIDRRELIYYIEDSDLPIDKINQLRKQIEKL